jgi:hypothetical protein
MVYTAYYIAYAFDYVPSGLFNGLVGYLVLFTFYFLVLSVQMLPD